MKVARIFEMEQGSTPGGYYQILVRFRGVIVENILLPTMREALDELARRGYTRIQ